MAFCNATHAAFLEAWFALYDLVMEDAKAISKTSPIWPNFPDDAMEADLVDLYVVNLLNYLTLGQWQPDFDPSKFCKALDREHLPAAKQIPAMLSRASQTTARCLPMSRTLSSTC